MLRVYKGVVHHEQLNFVTFSLLKTASLTARKKDSYVFSKHLKHSGNYMSYLL
jgi:hypothetical protein